MKTKADKYTLVEPDDYAYALLSELLASHHSTLCSASIGLLWEHGIKPDRDGHTRWGCARKVGAVDGMFYDHDFVIALNATVWAKLPEHGKRALLDHELCHCAVKTNESGDISFYMRKHDLEEFVEIVRRHGLWKADLEAFVNAALKREQKPLFEDAAAKAVKEFTDSIPAGVDVTLSHAGKSVTLTGGK